jgi:hypothetical protein
MAQNNDQSQARMQTYWLEAQEKCKTPGGYLAEPMTYWFEAQQKCETLGGYLAEPKTAWYVW